MGLSLRRNFSWALFGQVSFAFAQWLVVVLLARLDGAAGLGRYVLALAVVTPISTFAGLRLRSVQASDAASEFQFSDYWFARLVTAAGAFLAVAVAAFVGRQAWGMASGVTLMMLLIGFAKSVDLVSDAVHGFQQRHERMDQMAQSLLLRSVSIVLWVLFGVFAGGSLGAVAGLALGSLTSFVLLDLRSLRQIAKRADFEGWILRRDMLRSLLGLALPLGLTSTLASLATSIPRYFLEAAQGEAALGVFAAMIYPTVAAGMIMTAMAQSSVTRLALSFQSRDISGFKRILRSLLLFAALFGASGVIAAWGIGSWVIGIVYGSDFRQHHWVMVWGMGVAALGYCYLFLGTALTAMRQFRVQLPVHLTSLVVLLVGCSALVPELGIRGVLVSMSISVAAELVMYGSLVFRQVRVAFRGDVALAA